MTPKEAVKIIADKLNDRALSPRIVDDPKINYTPFVAFDIEVPEVGIMTFRIHATKRHKYLTLDTNAFLRIACLDSFLKTLEDDYIFEIGKIYYPSFDLFGTFLNQKLISKTEIHDQNADDTNKFVHDFVERYIADYSKVATFVHQHLTHSVLRDAFQDYKNLIFINGDIFKLIIPVDTNSKTIELAGLYIFNNANVDKWLSLLKSVTATESNDYSRNSYNKIVEKICERNGLNFEDYQSVDSPTSALAAKIRKVFYLAANKYRPGFKTKSSPSV